MFHAAGGAVPAQSRSAADAARRAWRACCRIASPYSRAAIRARACAIGDPHHITRELKKWEGDGRRLVNFMLNCVEVVPQEKVLASLRLFAKEVMPHFQKTPVTQAAE